MKKVLALILAAAMMLIMLSGCDIIDNIMKLFSGSGSPDTAVHESAQKTTGSVPATADETAPGTEETSDKNKTTGDSPKTSHETSGVVEPESVSVNKSSVSLFVGDSETVTATVSPSDADDKTVSWSSSNTGVASVSGGKITAISAGSAVVTASSKNGKTATVNVTVTKGTVAVQSVSVNKSSVSLFVGDSETVTATVSPSDADDKTVSWSSSNTSVASVSGGKITAVSAGSAVITASSINGKTAAVNVTVSKRSVPVQSVSVNKSSVSLFVGDSETVTATVSPADADDKNVSWSSSNTGVASVSGGKITAISAGSAVITASSKNGKTATVNVTVTKRSVPVQSVSVNKSSVSLFVGDSETVTATVSPADADDKTVSWSSSNTGVASVSGGKITAVSAGSAVITASSKNGKTATVNVTVSKRSVPVQSVSLNKSSVSLFVGDSATVTATVSPADADDKNVSWSSSNTGVASVSGGKITAVSAGSAVITASSKNGKTAEVRVTVKRKNDPAATYGYYYTTLTSDLDRSIYEEVYECFKKTQSVLSSASFFGKDGVTFEYATRVIRLVMNDHVEFFHLSGSFTGKTMNKLVTELDFTYSMTASEYEKALATVDSMTASAVSQAKAASDDHEKALILYNYVKGAMTYDSSFASSSYDLYGGLTTGKGVCEAYSELFAYLLKKVGIVSAIVTGGNHSWDIANINGEWYYFDPTYDDPTGEQVEGGLYLNYFAVNDGIIEKRHSFDNRSLLPSISAMTDNYYVRNGLVVEDLSDETLKKAALDSYALCGHVAFMASPEVFSAVLGGDTSYLFKLARFAVSSANSIVWIKNDDSLVIEIFIK